jgi:uncharacterized protein YbjT (DUF2867 family)
MAETILVTDATGTVASEVVKQLLSAKEERQEEEMIIKAAARSANDIAFRNLSANSRAYQQRP